MYRNAKANIFPDDSFLISFYENLLDLAHNKLDRESLICSELFENPQLLKNVSPDEAFNKHDRFPTNALNSFDFKGETLNAIKDAEDETNLTGPFDSAEAMFKSLDE